MKKRDEVDSVRIREYKASVIPLMITILFYWSVLSIYVIYLYVTKGAVGIPFYLLTSGAIIYGLSNLMYRRKRG